MTPKLLVAFAIILSFPGCGSLAEGATISQLFIADELPRDSITINFEGPGHNAPAASLYTTLGVSFSRDDGVSPVIFDWAELGRTTSSGTNVLATTGGAEGFTTHLNVFFAIPMTTLGFYFGNDQSSFLTNVRLSVFDTSDDFLGFVQVAPNQNRSVDQWIGLQSTVPFSSARIENLGASHLAVVIDDLAFVPELSSSSLLIVFFVQFVIWRRRVT